LIDNNRIGLNYKGKEYAYDTSEVTELHIESFDKLSITDEPLAKLYKVYVRQEPIPGYMVCLESKNFMIITETTSYIA